MSTSQQQDSTNSNATSSSTSPPNDVEGKCYVCNVDTNLRCQNCSKVPTIVAPFYCGKEHQKQHWKSGHKSECGGSASATATTSTSTNNVASSNLTLKSDPSFNDGTQYYVTKIPRKTGEIIFKKQILLSYPRVPTVDEQIVRRTIPPYSLEDPSKYAVYSCLSCYEFIIYGQIVQDPVNGLRLHKCIRCSWPVHCNIINGQPPSDCDEIHEKECQILVKSKIKWDSIKDKKFAYIFIPVLRVFLLSESDREILQGLPIPWQSKIDPYLIEGIQEFPSLLSRCGFKITMTDLIHMLLKITRNAIIFPNARPHIRNKMAWLIYKDAPSLSGRILPHSCIPNTTLLVDKTTFEGTFKLNHDVKKNEMLTITHLEDHFQPFIKRMYMLNTIPSSCKCPRCNSQLAMATEGDTFYSTIKCPSSSLYSYEASEDAKHYLVPSRFVKHTGSGCEHTELEYTCLAPGCKTALPQSEVDAKINLIQSDFSNIALSNDYNAIRKMINAYSGKLVHPNHHTLHFMRIQLAKIADNDIIKLKQYQNARDGFKLHGKYLQDFEILLEQLEKILPGRNYYRGRNLFCATLLRMSQLAEEITNTPTSELNSKYESLATLDNTQIKSIYLNLVEACLILKEVQAIDFMEFNTDKILRSLYIHHLRKCIKEAFEKTNLPESTNNATNNNNWLDNLPHLKMLQDQYGQKEEFDWKDFKEPEQLWTVIAESHLSRVRELPLDANIMYPGGP